MFAKFFKAPTYSGGTWSTFSDDRLFVTDSIESYEYTKLFTKTGSFTMTLPFSENILKKLVLNGTIFFDNDWLWVQSIQYDGRKITISGKDCKGFLDTRISLYGDTQVSGAEGYDIVSGTTADCIKHYLDNNCISPEDTSRKLPLEWSSGAYGLASDHYMARLEYISDIITSMCENAGIGFDVRGNIADRGFKFYLLKGVDRSFNQTKNPRVIFSSHWRNIVSQSFEHGIDNLLNAVYATDVDEVSQLVATSASGISRRECNVNVGISHTDSWFEKYALKEIKDNVKTESFDIAVPFSNYGTDYELGDIVTVKDDFAGGFYNRAIAEVTKSYSSGQRSISLVLGIPKQKPVQKLVNNLINKTQQRK